MKKVILISVTAAVGLALLAWTLRQRGVSTEGGALTKKPALTRDSDAGERTVRRASPLPGMPQQGVAAASGQTMESEMAEVVEERRRQMKIRFTKSFDLIHGALYGQLGFTDAQRITFLDLRFNSMERQQALAKAAIKDPRVAKDRDGMQMTGQVAAEVAYQELQEAIVREFGEKTAKEILAFQWKAPAREITNQLNSDVGEFGLGLSSVQTERLVDLIATHSQPGTTNIDLETLEIEKVCEAARGFLSESQVSALRRANATVRAKFFPLGGRGPTVFRAQ